MTKPGPFRTMASIMAYSSRSSKKNSQPPTGCLFWLLLIIVVLILFVVNWGKIQKTLSETHFTEIVQNSRDQQKNKPAPVAPVNPSSRSDTEEPAAPQPQNGAGSSGRQGTAQPEAGNGSVQPVSPSQSPAAEKPESPAPQSQKQPAAKPSDSSQSGKTQGSQNGSSAGGAQRGSSAQSAEQKKQSGNTAAPAASSGRETKPAAKPETAVKMRTASLFFVRIEDDGAIVRQEVKRQIPSSDSPLSDSMAALLAGPNADEMRRSLVTLIPAGTKLISAQVRGGTVFLNFNEAFMYNHYGIEGYAGQLKQVVYTATSFPSVQDVQILIEGERHDYLGGEGVYIGKPLSRGSF